MRYLIFVFFITLADASASYRCSTSYGALNIPHVKTSSIDEFYYCFGLSHGSDRAWTMDFFRRVGRGTNAEILGLSQLKSDLMMRLLDLPSKAEEIWKNFPDDKRDIIVKYVEGVNEGFKKGKSSREFKDLDYIPNPWKPEDTILVLLLQSFDQTRKTFVSDYNEEKSKERLSYEAAALFDEDNMPWENTILKDGEYQKREFSNKTSQTSPHSFNLWSEFPTVFGKESGSNNWAISSAKSKNGKALLANDPHLDLKTPLFWYWINIRTPELTVMGGSVPGVPVIATGTNGKVSWGLTNSYLNSADALLVKDVSKNDIESFRPTVIVKFGFFKLPFFFKSFEKLKTGHRVLPLDVDSEDKLVLRWTGFEVGPEDIYKMFDLVKMKNVSEMNELTSQIGLPSWNFVFADTKGDIGYRLVGKTYRQTKKDSYGIESVSMKELSQVEILAPEDRPHVLRPKRNYVYTANNRHWPVDAKYYGGRGYSYSFRGFRIDELLQGKHDVDSFRRIQCDIQVVDARFFLEKIQKHLNVPEFRNWSMEASDSSVILPLYRRLMDIMQEGWKVNEYALFKILDRLNPIQNKEIIEFLAQARRDVGEKKWGEMHRLKFPHMSKNESWIFSPEISGVGDTHTVNPGTSVWNNDLKIYEQTSGASMRMIVEMGKTPKIWLSLPGVNREYDIKTDNKAWQSWRDCQYAEVDF